MSARVAAFRELTLGGVASRLSLEPSEKSRVHDRGFVQRLVGTVHRLVLTVQRPPSAWLQSTIYSPFT